MSIANLHIPRAGGFYLLHPADTRAYMTNLRHVLEQQESFQLWCQLQIARLTHCIEQIEQLECTPATRPAGVIPNTQHPFGPAETALWINQIYKLRRTTEETIRILRPYRFGHHRHDQLRRAKHALYQDFQQKLTTRDMVCHEPPPRARAHQQDNDGDPMCTLPCRMTS